MCSSPFGAWQATPGLQIKSGVSVSNPLALFGSSADQPTACGLAAEQLAPGRPTSSDVIDGIHII
jgi:hypothetical protein